MFFRNFTWPWQGPSFEQVKRLEMSLVEAEKEVQEAKKHGETRGK
jgi:hypothetical protein